MHIFYNREPHPQYGFSWGVSRLCALVHGNAGQWACHEAAAGFCLRKSQGMNKEIIEDKRVDLRLNL